ncbi:MAG: hypothetical protein M1819_007377 [Sarea resinae]|nr:MAG: hypothetical protein M1819_007377 [Sarea resinae]
MNWTGGKLARHSKTAPRMEANNLDVLQKRHFARARAKLQAGTQCVSPHKLPFAEERGFINDVSDAGAGLKFLTSEDPFETGEKGTSFDHVFPNSHQGNRRERSQPASISPHAPRIFGNSTRPNLGSSIAKPEQFNCCQGKGRVDRKVKAEKSLTSHEDSHVLPIHPASNGRSLSQKRRSLLDRNDWTGTVSERPLNITFPSSRNAERIGKRRKINKGDWKSVGDHTQRASETIPNKRWERLKQSSGHVARQDVHITIGTPEQQALGKPGNLNSVRENRAFSSTSDFHSSDSMLLDREQDKWQHFVPEIGVLKEDLNTRRTATAQPRVHSHRRTASHSNFISIFEDMDPVEGAYGHKQLGTYLSSDNHDLCPAERQIQDPLANLDQTMPANLERAFEENSTDRTAGVNQTSPMSLMGDSAQQMRETLVEVPSNSSPIDPARLVFRSSPPADSVRKGPASKPSLGESPLITKNAEIVNNQTRSLTRGDDAISRDRFFSDESDEFNRIVSIREGVPDQGDSYIHVTRANGSKVSNPGQLFEHQDSYSDIDDLGSQGRSLIEHSPTCQLLTTSDEGFPYYQVSDAPHRPPVEPELDNGAFTKREDRLDPSKEEAWRKFVFGDLPEDEDDDFFASFGPTHIGGIPSDGNDQNKPSGGKSAGIESDISLSIHLNSVSAPDDLPASTDAHDGSLISAADSPDPYHVANAPSTTNQLWGRRSGFISQEASFSTSLLMLPDALVPSRNKSQGTHAESVEANAHQPISSPDPLASTSPRLGFRHRQPSHESRSHIQAPFDAIQPATNIVFSKPKPFTGTNEGTRNETRVVHLGPRTMAARSRHPARATKREGRDIRSGSRSRSRSRPGIHTSSDWVECIEDD